MALPTKRIVPPAPPTDSHHDDGIPVIHTTAPPGLQSAGREHRPDSGQVLNRSTPLGRHASALGSFPRPDEAARAELVFGSISAQVYQNDGTCAPDHRSGDHVIGSATRGRAYECVLRDPHDQSIVRVAEGPPEQP